MNNSPQLLKGFRDFYPEDQAFQSWFYQKAREVAESFGFMEYEGPTLEPLELYAAKSGEELVKKQAFTLVDKSGKTVALRPEMTPTLARMITQKLGSLTFPIKWFTYGRRFRYETPQKGRGREFFQWDVDILGLDNVEADIEILTVAASFYQKLGLTPQQAVIKINDRKFLTDQLMKLKIPGDKVLGIFKVIDKNDKVSNEEFVGMLSAQEINSDQITGINRILANRNGWQDSDWLTVIFKGLKQTGLTDYFEFDPSIVRGLDYYTRTVFEGSSRLGKLRALWGGGRYDNLVIDVGGKQRVPGVGFAVGDMAMSELLQTAGKYPKLKSNKTKVLVTIFSSELSVSSMKVSTSLRKTGVNAEIYLDPSATLDKQLKYADRKGIPFVVIIGSDEAKNGTVTVKNLVAKSQQTIPLEALSKFINHQSSLHPLPFSSSSPSGLSPRDERLKTLRVEDP